MMARFKRAMARMEDHWLLPLHLPMARSTAWAQPVAAPLPRMTSWRNPALG
jgi:hypothetical protein